MISISEAASCEVLRLRSKQPNSELFFRLGIQPGGCCDWIYQMGFDSTLQPDDVVYQCGTLQVVVSSEALKYLDNLAIDYSEDLMGGGFRFQNPNAEQSCSCGNSFALPAS